MRSSILTADTADLGTLDAFLSKDECAWRETVEDGLTSSAIAFGVHLQFQPETVGEKQAVNPTLSGHVSLMLSSSSVGHPWPRSMSAI